MGSAAGHEGPHVSKPHYYASKFLLVTTYLWIMYRFKEDNGQLLGQYEPWKHPHVHEEPLYRFEHQEDGTTIVVDIETGEPLGEED
jgi:hypothetical protein